MQATTAVLPDKAPLALRVSHVSKQYRLGSIGGRTLQADLQSWWARMRGQQDPNLRIGQDSRLVGKDFWALRDVSLEVARGERVGIIGANGAGKSTLLKLLSRITVPTEGEIDLWGRVTSMLEVGTGFHREMTGRENIYLNGAILGMTRAEIDGRMDDIIDFSEVREFIDTPVKRYSSGMFVKLAFSVAAHLPSEIMIMDEVLAVGDMAFQRKCLDRMRRAADEEGRTVLYVSHNMETIRRLCDRCVVMSEGRIVFDGDVQEGIGAYMEHALAHDEVDIDLSAMPRSYHGGELGLRMERLAMVDKVLPVYAPGEPLALVLTLSADEAYRGLRVRLTLRTQSDVGLGTSWSEPFDLDGAGLHEIEILMDTACVQGGVLYASVGVYRTDELGRQFALDHVTRAFRVEFDGVPTWDVNAHGYVELPTMKCGVEPASLRAGKDRRDDA